MVEVRDVQSCLPGAQAGRNPGAGLLASAGRFTGLMVSAFSCFGKKSSASSLEGSSVTCLLSSQRGAKCLPAP